MHWYKTNVVPALVQCRTGTRLYVVHALVQLMNVMLYCIMVLLQREEQSRYAAVIEEHSQEEQEMRKQCDEQMKQMEDEKV